MRKLILILTVVAAAAAPAIPAAAQVPPSVSNNLCVIEPSKGFDLCRNPLINWCKDVSGWRIIGCVPPHALLRD
jgi:hypothetical protein